MYFFKKKVKIYVPTLILFLSNLSIVCNLNPYISSLKYNTFALFVCIFVGGLIKFCIRCNISIYIRHMWIKPVLCSRMVSLFHHTSP